MKRAENRTNANLQKDTQKKGKWIQTRYLKT